MSSLSHHPSKMSCHNNSTCYHFLFFFFFFFIISQDKLLKDLVMQLKEKDVSEPEVWARASQRLAGRDESQW